VSDPIVLEFDALPALAGQYAKGLVARGRGASAPVVPRLEARVRGVTVDAVRLAAYRRTCGFPGSDQLPPTYPQVLAGPLHAALMAHAAFPFPVLGLVHVRNAITQKRPLGQAESLDLHCFVEGAREARSGYEFDIVTRVDAAGATVWEATTTVLARRATNVKKPARSDPPKPAEPPGEPPGALRSILWRVPADQGRRYAGVSGDWNPIHVHALTAKAFGFRRAIAHGMWTLARCLAELEDAGTGGPLTLEAAFRRPVFLPTQVLFTAHPQPDGFAFALRSRDAMNVHLAGTLSFGK
jgi:acyl dehydratase